MWSGSLGTECFSQAARDITQGEVILCEQAYVSVLESSLLTTHCSCCFKKCPDTLLPWVSSPAVTCPFFVSVVGILSLQVCVLCFRGLLFSRVPTESMDKASLDGVQGSRPLEKGDFICLPRGCNLLCRKTFLRRTPPLKSCLCPDCRLDGGAVFEDCGLYWPC